MLIETTGLRSRGPGLRLTRTLGACSRLSREKTRLGTRQRMEVAWASFLISKEEGSIASLCSEHPLLQELAPAHTLTLPSGFRWKHAFPLLFPSEKHSGRSVGTQRAIEKGPTFREMLSMASQCR